MPPDEPRESDPRVEQPPEESPEAPGDGEATSWAAIFGGGTGLLLGVLVGLAVSAAIHALEPGSRWVEIAWQVVGPLLGILGLLTGSVVFQRWFRGQLFLPAMLFSLALAATVLLAFGPLSGPWRPPPEGVLMRDAGAERAGCRAGLQACCLPLRSSSFSSQEPTGSSGQG